MADDAAPDVGNGQAGGEPAQPASGAAPSADAGQATAGQGNPQGQPQGPSAADDSFFDPKAVPAELQPAYKQMQAAFTKKMQALASVRDKAAFADQFQQNPLDVIQRVAQQYGMRLTPAQAAAVAQQQAPDGQQWQPNSWDEVIGRAKKEAQQDILQQLTPLLKEVQAMKQTAIERQLSEIDPTWQQYEDAMMQNLKVHPTLANDPAKLYALSVPQEVIESRATQRALQRFEQKGKSAAVSPGSTTNKKPAAAVREASSFEEAVQFAREQLAEQGLLPPK